MTWTPGVLSSTGNLSPSEAIRRLTEERDAARFEVDALRAALERIASNDAGSASDRRGIARRALLSTQKDDER